MKSVRRLIQTMDDSGNVVSENIQNLEIDKLEGFGGYSDYISQIGTYEIQDSFDAQNNSP